MPQLISYACWAPILLHMNADSRIQISLRCPSFKTLDSQIPTKVNKLQLQKYYGVKMDHVKFEIVPFMQKFEGRLIPFYQIVVCRKNLKTILARATEKKAYVDVAKCLIQKIFSKNFRIGSAIVHEYLRNLISIGFDVTRLGNAKSLIFHDIVHMKDIVLLRNTRVFFSQIHWDSASITKMIRDWQEKQPPVGQRYTVKERNVPAAKLFTELVKKFPEATIGEIPETRGEELFSHCITLPVSTDTEFNFYILNHCEELEPADNFIFMFFVIHPKGYAYPH